MDAAPAASPACTVTLMSGAAKRRQYMTNFQKEHRAILSAIDPSKKPGVYNNNDDAKAALREMIIPGSLTDERLEQLS